MSTNFPVTLDSYAVLVDNTDDVLAAHPNDRGDAIEALEAKVGVDSSAVTTSIDYKVNNFFATGRKVYLYENTAPTGWSITAVTDSVLAVKGGTGLYNTTGGTTAGTSWANLKAHTHTGPSHTHTGPNHNHQVRNYQGTTTADQYYDISGNAQNFSQAQMSSNYHMSVIQSDYSLPADMFTTLAGTGATGAGGTGATGAGGTGATYRPSAAVGIICTKS